MESVDVVVVLLAEVVLGLKLHIREGVWNRTHSGYFLQMPEMALLGYFLQMLLPRS